MSRISKEFLPRSTKSPLKMYGFSKEGLDQFGHPTESHGEGQMGASVAVRHLNALVAENRREDNNVKYLKAKLGYRKIKSQVPRP
ncbi:hypothetical protein INR49_025880 [Caranx melampygus]|nr:hypothetical protein INR49_025880 [Caranx melampygus]